MYKTLFSFLFLCLFQSIGYSQNLAKPLFEPPLKISPVVSGSFGELRTNHFHSGLDLTTNGRTGYNVYCSDDGFVSRIKISPYGYGKAIYVDHPNGYTTVYAHLIDYNTRIDSFVLAAQYAAQSYDIELLPKKDELKVRRGEVLAFTGNSGGSGGPHLHYEIRYTNTQIPTNPMLYRSDILDTTKPLIRGIKLYPLTNSSTINGKNEALYVSVEMNQGQYQLKGGQKVSAQGSIGVGVDVIDFLNVGNRKCGVSSIELMVDNRVKFHSLINEFSFSESRYINSHIDYAEKQKTGRVIQKSFVDANNKLHIYQVKNSESFSISLAQTRELKYIVKDVRGNVSTLNFKVNGEAQLPHYHPKAVRLMDCKQAFVFDTLGFAVKIPEGALYTDLPFSYSSESNAAVKNKRIFTFGSASNPLHEGMTVILDFPSTLNAYRSKAFVASVAANGKIGYLGGQVTNGKIQTTTRSFDSFAIGVDTIVPTISFINVPAGSDYGVSKSIRVEVRDEMSGITDYRCTIDGTWALFEYDAKNNVLIGDFKRMPFLTKGKHVLEVSVTDAKGNQASKTKNFSY